MTRGPQVRGAHAPAVDVLQKAEEGRAVAQVVILDVRAGPQARVVLAGREGLPRRRPRSESLHFCHHSPHTRIKFNEVTPTLARLSVAPSEPLNALCQDVLLHPPTLV